MHHTRLHALLGSEAPLDYNLIRHAVRDAVREDEQLDWKRTLTLDNEREVAKDVAAMANTSGGLLVYGVAQHNQTSAAAKIMPVDVSDRILTRLHQALERTITPRIGGLDVLALREPDGDGTRGVLVVQVPPSPEAPHLIGGPTSFAAPYRAGPSTAWMLETQLERAYATRRDGDAARGSRLHELVEKSTVHLNPRFGWFVAAAVPVRPSAATSANRASTTGSAALAIRIGNRMTTGLRGVLAPRRPLAVVNEWSDTLLNPRPGLRRWVFADRGRDGREDVDVFVHCELHDDGALTLATTTGDSSTDPDAEEVVWVEETKIVGFAVDLVAMAYAHATARGVDGELRVLVDLYQDGRRKWALAAVERAGAMVINHLAQPGWTRRLTSFEPVNLDLAALVASAPEPEHDLPVRADRLAADIANQFGFGPFSVTSPGASASS